MRRIIEDIENEKFTGEEVVKWSVIYPAIGLTLFVIVSIMMGGFDHGNETLRLRQHPTN